VVRATRDSRYFLSAPILSVLTVFERLDDDVGTYRPPNRTAFEFDIRPRRAEPKRDAGGGAAACDRLLHSDADAIKESTSKLRTAVGVRTGHVMN